METKAALEQHTEQNDSQSDCVNLESTTGKATPTPGPLCDLNRVLSEEIMTRTRKSQSHGPWRVDPAHAPQVLWVGVAIRWSVLSNLVKNRAHLSLRLWR